MSEVNNGTTASDFISYPVTKIILGSDCPADGRIHRLRIRRGQVEASRAAGTHRFAFAGLLVFTALLYLRPQEMFPEVLGTFPLIRIVAIVTLLAYFIPRLLKNETLTIFPIELKALGAIFLLGIAFTPLASAPGDSVEVLLDLFIKVAAIFVLMINVINTPKRLGTIMAVVVVCGTVLAIFAVSSYIAGDFKTIVKNEGFVVGMRIFGPVGGIVGNPNDLATSLNMLLPLAVVLALTRRGLARTFFLACSCLLLAGVVVTFSRGGFLGFIAMGAVLLWKVSRQNRALMGVALVVLLGVFALAMPTGYAGRISSIFNIGEDLTGSSASRRDLLERVAVVALYHPLVGVGMGNYHIYSVREQVSHNSYLETAAELGVAGLVAYLVLIFAPLRSLRRIERETLPQDATMSVARGEPDPRIKLINYMSTALQAVLVAYIVCSFFGSIQYQWFLYYPVAYAIALRQIHKAEQASSVTQNKKAVVTQESNRPRGVLWKPRQRQVAQVPAGLK